MDMKDVDRDNEVNRILGAFKLNPFEQLGINFDCTMEDIRRQYRKVSLMVHPDKCKHPRATDAFEVLGNANKSLSDEEHVRELRHALTLARGRRKLLQHGHACFQKLLSMGMCADLHVCTRPACICLSSIAAHSGDT